MYIVAIAWLYVVLMMSITERSIVAGIMTFLFYGLLPCALLIWVVGTPSRRRLKVAREAARAAAGAHEASVAEQQVHAPDRRDTNGNQ
jgi:small-conductance mechanosensitive channel